MLSQHDLVRSQQSAPQLSNIKMPLGCSGTARSMDNIGFFQYCWSPREHTNNNPLD